MAEIKPVSYVPEHVRLRQKRDAEAAVLHDSAGEVTVDLQYAMGAPYNVIFPKPFNAPPIVCFSLESTLKEVEVAGVLVSRNSAGFTVKIQSTSVEPDIKTPPWTSTKVTICWMAMMAH